MAQKNNRKYLTGQSNNGYNFMLQIFKGVLVSAVISMIFALALTAACLNGDSTFIDQYFQYIALAISMISIFIGSLIVTWRAQSKGLLIGVTIGFIYVLLSVGFGMKLNHESITLFVLANKLFAGIASGALGGMVGVSL